MNVSVVASICLLVSVSGASSAEELTTVPKTVPSAEIAPQADLFEQLGEGLKQQPSAGTVSSFFSSLTKPSSYIAYKELYASGLYSHAVDRLSGRNSLGFLLYGTFSGSKGQIADLNVQGRAAYYNNQFSHGMLMPREYTQRLNQLKWELHNAYLRGRLFPPTASVRVGHFYVPYGLQPWIDTHGTLLQGPAMEFIGMDRDWGVSVDGQSDAVEYQMGLTRGSGMEYFERANNYALAAKLSTPRTGEHVNDWTAISCLVGRIYDPMAVRRLKHKGRHNIVQRWRLGVDGQKIVGPARLRFEVSGGQDERSADLLGEFVEWQQILDGKGSWYSYLQFENLTQNGKKSDTTIRVGLTHVFSANYNLQFVISRDLRTMWGHKDTWIGLLLYGQLGFG